MNQHPKIRPLRNNEREQLAALYNSAYRIGMETGRQWAADTDMPSGVACVMPDGRIASSVRILPYDIFVGGHLLPMGGIGGVATWADLQGHGYAGKCMEAAITMLHKKGYAASALYPFSHRYYGRYGWKLCAEQTVYHDLTQAQFTRFDESRLVRCVTDAHADANTLARLNNDFALMYNGMAQRTAAQMEKRVKDNAATNAGQTYIIEDGGNAIGYFMHENIKEGWYSHCRVARFACLTPAAWRAMTGFCATLPTNVSKITICAPVTPSLRPYALEPTLPTQTNCLFMGRVIDMSRAIEMRGYGRDVNGMIRVKIDDPCAPWNNGVWQLNFLGGAAQARKLDYEGAEFNIAMDIGTFSQLWFGYLDPVRLQQQGLIGDMRPDTARFLTHAFHDRTPYLTEVF